MLACVFFLLCFVIYIIIFSIPFVLTVLVMSWVQRRLNTAAVFAVLCPKLWTKLQTCHSHNLIGYLIVIGQNKRVIISYWYCIVWRNCSCPFLLLKFKGHLLIDSLFSLLLSEILFWSRCAAGTFKHQLVAYWKHLVNHTALFITSETQCA